MNEWEAPEGQRPPMSYYDGLYHEYATGILRLCYYYLGNREQAEDVVQDVFVRIITAGVTIKPGSEKAYLLKAAMKIKSRRGIAVDELCSSLGWAYSKASRIITTLECDGLISVDLLQHCSPRLDK